jgi:predicted TIM-barrel fold metal-dependent hydrolase
VKLNVNGADVEVDDRLAASPLLWVLRDVLGLHGTKYGCGIGYCAACTVLIDGRFAIIDQMNVIPGAQARETAAETFRRLYWDTALSWGDPVLRMLRDVVGIDHVVFGSDYPYLRRDLAVSCRGHIEASPELTDSDRTAVLGGTATTLIPRLATVR